MRRRPCCETKEVPGALNVPGSYLVSEGINSIYIYIYTYVHAYVNKAKHINQCI